MRYIKTVLAIFTFSVLIFSCSKKNNLGKMIPKNAAMVVDINTKSLYSKLSFDEIKQTFWFQHLMSDSNHFIKAKPFIDDPSKMGINLKSDIIAFALMPNNQGQFVVEGSIKDSKAFADFVTAMHPQGIISKEGKLNFLKSDTVVLAWNDDNFVFVTNSPQTPMNTGDSTTVAIPIKPSSDNLISVCKNLFSLSDDSSLYKNERFAKLLDEDGDAHFWLNANELYKGSMQSLPPMVGMVKLDKFLEDNISTATINFEDGKITANQKQYFGKELSDILKSGSGNINTEMIKRNSSVNTAAVFSMHFNPENLLGVIRLTGLDGFMNLFLGQKGLSLEDIAKASKGDMFFAVSDLTLHTDSMKMHSDSRDSIKHSSINSSGTFLFSIAVNDKVAFNKITDLGKTMGKDLTTTTTFSKTDDKYFVVSNKQDALNNYFSGTASNPSFIDKIKDHPIGGYVDLQMILKSMQPAVTADSAENIMYQKNIAMWNNIYVTGGEYKDGGLVANTEVNLMDKSTNSLKQLNKLIDEMAKTSLERKKRNMSEWGDPTKNRTATDSLRKNKHR